MQRVLVTGFGPFPDVPQNPSELLVRRIAGGALRPRPGIQLTTEILPTEWHRVSQIAPGLRERHGADIVLHVGVATKAHRLRIETMARNRTQNSPDAAGNLPPNAQVNPGAPPLLVSALPAGRISLSLRSRGIAASPSKDAGAYLCNSIFYQSLRHTGLAGRPANVLFIHIPPPAAGTDEETLLKAMEAIIGICAAHVREAIGTM